MTGLEHFTLSEPQLTRSIAGHTPVSSGAQANAANLGAVGQTRALELLGEEAAEECLEPMLDDVIVVPAFEGFLRKQENLHRAESMTHEIIEEEVVELVGANQVLCLLLDIAILVGRNQFGTDGSVDHIMESGRGVGIHSSSNKLDQTSNKCFGDAGIDSIHAHVVAIVRTPTKSQLGQVASTDNESTLLIAYIHQYLGTLSGLRVLISSVMNRDVVTDILKVLGHALGNAYLSDGDAETLHELDGIGVSSVGSAETGHGHTDNSAAIES